MLWHKAQGAGGFSTAASGFDITGATKVHTQDISGQINLQARGIFFHPDGDQMYVLDNTGYIEEYSLSTAWDISTETAVSESVIRNGASGTLALYFKPDGLRFYIAHNNSDSVEEYDLSVAWDSSTNTHDISENGSVSAQTATPNGVFFKPDGTKMYVSGGDSDAIYEYDLSTAWSPASLTYVQRLTSAGNDVREFFFSSDGSRFIVACFDSDEIRQFDLSTAWDISTATLDYTLDVSGDVGGSGPSGVFVGKNGSKLYITTTNSRTIVEYDI